MINFRDNLIIFILASVSVTNSSFSNTDDVFIFHDNPEHHRISKRQTGKSGEAASCKVPSTPTDHVYQIYGSDHELITGHQARTSVPKFSQIESTCLSGYVLLDGSNTSTSYCNYAGEWIPALRSCHRVCPVLRTPNVVLTCKDKRGGVVDCNGPSLTSGTQVTAHCMPLHQVDSLSRSDSDFIRCRDDGRWDNELIKCVPECGVPLHQPLIANGSEAQFGEFPWHVAIYRVSLGNKYICGGTLITTNMVLSAAHCFYDERNAHSNNDPGDYVIIVGKMTSDFNRVDSIQQQKLQISRIKFAPNAYNPTNSYASDIAIIILKENVTISQYVLPACFRRPERFGNFRPRNNSLGALPGWGLDENNKVSNTLKMALLPFMDYNKCSEKVAHVTIDKFCAGNGTGPRPLQGDSGGGLVFKEGLFFYVRGIVSTRGKWSDTSLTTFTDISFYQDWIELVIQQDISGSEGDYKWPTSTERSVILPSSTSPSTLKTSRYTSMNRVTTLKPKGSTLPILQKNKTDSKPDERCKALSTSKIRYTCQRVTDCKHFNTSQKYLCGSNKERICCPDLMSTQPKNYTQTINQKCVDYAEARYQNVCNTGQMDVAGCNRVLDCEPVETLIEEGVKVKPKEFPHMAIIGVGEDVKQVYWFCSGTLISERFILTSAYCSEQPYQQKPAVWIGLGFVNKSELITSAQLNKRVFRIEKWHYHPKYKRELFDHDIGLAELRNPVKFSPYIRPICLHTGDIVPKEFLDDITVARWGNGGIGETLLKASLHVISSTECTGYENYATLEAGFDAENMMCIRASEFENGFCDRDRGGPVQIKHTMECMYTQVGIISSGLTFCDSQEFHGGIRIIHYLDWIQKVVWP